MKKKIISLLLAAAMAASLLYGCAKPEETTAESISETVTETKAEKKAETGENKAAQKENVAAQKENATAQKDGEITLESIAKLNGCDVGDLNTLFNEEGYLTFIGNPISDEKITDERDVEKLIKRMSGLLGLEGIGVAYQETHYSPITGNSYYTFAQTALGNVAGYENVSIEFFSSTLKVGVDKNGIPNAVSSNLNHNELLESGSSTITAEQANKTVMENYPDINILPEHTSLTYWDDHTSAAINEGAKLALTWVVYGDAVESATDDSDDSELSCAGYNAYIVSAIDEGDGSGKILAVIDSPELDALTDVTEPVNTTNVFFEDMEDAGTYTYTVNFDWMNDVDKACAVAYEGENKLEVTVPVMKNKKDGLYYLGNKEHHIYMSNYYDVFKSEGDIKKFNPYVTENPDELSAWHFKTDKCAETGQKYFDDPNYVIASFASYVDTVNRFGTKFDIFNLYPNDSYLLGTYGVLDISVYPENKDEFFPNCCNLGQNYDWMLFMTSPAMGICLDDNTMAHEFTHGVNQHFSNARYCNEQGAMMESYADVIGTLTVSVTDDIENSWFIGGTYGPVLRYMRNPLEHSQPRYRNGLYYISRVDTQISDVSYNDCGGVHTNSGVPNYLAYLMTDGKTDNDDEDQLTYDEALNLWYETLYLGNYDTDFTDQSVYFIYAAEQTGLSEEKVNYMNRLLYELGFFDGDVKCNLLDAEVTKDFTITLSYDNEEIQDAFKFGVMIIAFDEDHGSSGFQLLGGFADSLIQQSKVDTTQDFNLMSVDTCDSEGVHHSSAFKYDGSLKECTLNVSYKELAEDESLIFDENEELLNFGGAEGLKKTTDKKTGETVITALPGTTWIAATHKEGEPDGDYNIYIVKFNMEDVDPD